MTDKSKENLLTAAQYDSLLGKVLSGFAWQSATKIAVQIIAWVSTIIVARILDPQDYGLIAIVGIFNGFLIVLVDLGLARGLIQYPQVTQRQFDGVFYMSLALGLVAFLIMVSAAPLIAEFYELDALTPLLQVAAFGLLFESIKTVPFAIVMRAMNFRYRSIVEMIANTTGMAVLLVLALLGYGVWSLLLSFLVMRAVTALAYLPLMKSIPRLDFNFREISGICSFGLKVTANNALDFVHREADLFVIGKTLGATVLGTYGMAMQLARMPIEKIGAIFTQVVFPAVSQIGTDSTSARRFYLDTHRNLLLITFPMLVGMALVANDLVIVLLTDKWQNIIPILQVFCILNLLRVSAMLVSPVLYGRGRPELMTAYLVLAAITIPISVFVGSKYGINGILVAWCVVYPGLYIFLMRFCLRNLGLQAMPFIGSFVPASVASAAMAGAVFFSQTLLSTLPEVGRLGASIGVGAAVYAATVFIAFPHDARSFRTGISRLVSQRG